MSETVAVNLFSTGFVNPVVMSAIRPDLPTFISPAPPARDTAAREAQAAFFRAALGGSETPAARNPVTAPSLAAPPVAAPLRQAAAGPVRPAGTATPTPPTSSVAHAAEPERYLRPGSYIDIKI